MAEYHEGIENNCIVRGFLPNKENKSLSYFTWPDFITSSLLGDFQPSFPPLSSTSSLAKVWAYSWSVLTEGFLLEGLWKLSIGGTVSQHQPAPARTAGRASPSPPPTRFFRSLSVHPVTQLPSSLFLDLYIFLQNSLAPPFRAYLQEMELNFSA